MSSRKLILAATSLLLVGCSSITSQTQTTPTTTQTQEASVSPSAMPTMQADNVEATDSARSKTYTMEEIAKHSTAKDCWFAIEDNVYDVTGFIASGKHGGGPAIIEGCGKDATQLFETRPMGSGTPHSDKARSFLPNFQIGILAE